MPMVSIRWKLIVLWLMVVVLLLIAGNSGIIAYAEVLNPAVKVDNPVVKVTAPPPAPSITDPATGLLAMNRKARPVEAAAPESGNESGLDKPAKTEPEQGANPEAEPEKLQSPGAESKAKAETKPKAESKPKADSKPKTEQTQPAEAAAAQPETQPEAKPPEPAPEAEPAPEQPPAIEYKFGSSHKVKFRTEITITNNGDQVAENIRVKVPMLEDKSPYQSTKLVSTSYPVAATEGRIATFEIGSLQPGESTKITADYSLTLKPVSLTSTNNETVAKAKKAFDKYQGNGNCLELATAFVNYCKDLGVKARLVYGFTRPQRQKITSGSLKGCRHSWGEFYVEDLGWVPVDLTFGYFAKLPYASHVIEGYSNQSISVKYSGGKLAATWSNAIL